MKEIKAFFFDLDGVVFDTEPQYTDFWKSQCVEFHPEIPGLENMIKGQTLIEIYEKYFSDKLVDKRDLISARLKLFESKMEFKYVSGFQTFINSLLSVNIKTAVVTSSNREKMQHVYNSHPNFKQLFDVILTSEDFDYSKPNPECYLKAARYFNLSNDECVVFEDSFNGLMAGRNAGMKVVGLATTNKRELIEPYSDIVIDDYKGFVFSRYF